MIEKKVSGVFTGSYAVNPITGKNIPIYISDYVLAGYGTGAIMAVPAHDSRDYAFAKHFDLPIIPLIEGADVSEESFDAKEGIMANSSNERLQLNGLAVKEAIAKTKQYIEETGIGHVKVNYRLRDAIFSRQRYWGEPFPIYYDENKQPQPLDEKYLPLQLPEVDKFLPTETGEPPLGRAKNWVTADGYPLELNTMPGFAGSSAYYLRYMDPHNDEALVSREADEYWRQVDLYVNIVHADALDIEKFREWRPEFKDAEFILENGKYICGWAIEKMSKSMFNVVNPDDIVDRYGADTLRLYEMFLGPVEASKPWDTNGIDGVNRFLKRLWALFYKGDNLQLVDEKPSAEALKSLHKLIKKVSGDIESFSYNTSVAAFMICVNELTSMKCRTLEIYEPLVVLLAPFAPHIAEELWHVLGHETTVCDAQWPTWNEEYLKESTVKYTVLFNGKPRYNIEVAAGTAQDEVQRIALSDAGAERWLDGKQPKKVIVVPNKIVNVVV